jgi:nitrite reductase (NADH) small subunit
MAASSTRKSISSKDPWAERAAGKEAHLHQHIAEIRPFARGGSKLMVTADWLDIGPVDQLPALGARTLPVQGGDEIAIFRTANGSVYALVNKCPHKQGPLSQGIVHDTTVTCPLHNWRISLVSGEALGDDVGAACRPSR